MRRDSLTYRYPRTSIEAFGCNAEESIAFYKYTEPSTTMDRLCRVAALVIAVATLAIFLVR